MPVLPHAQCSVDADETAKLIDTKERKKEKGKGDRKVESSPAGTPSFFHFWVWRVARNMDKEQRGENRGRVKVYIKTAARRKSFPRCIHRTTKLALEGRRVTDTTARQEAKWGYRKQKTKKRKGGKREKRGSQWS